MRFSRMVLAMVLVAIVALQARVVAAADVQPQTGKVLRAGACAIDITPTKLPAIVNGGFAERKVSEITDRLHARCLVLDDGTGQVAIAVVDNCVIGRDLLDEAKELAHKATGIPVNRMLISATHCHSAPAVFAILGSARDEDYAKFLPGKIAEGIAAAQKNLRPARIGWAVGKDPKNVFCRRFLMKPGTAAKSPFTGHTDNQAQMNPGHQNPNAIRRTGVADTDVSVVSLQTLDGKPLALMANYSTHYAGAPGISADYFGVFCQRIAELLDHHIQSCAADEAEEDDETDEADEDGDSFQ